VTERELTISVELKEATRGESMDVVEQACVPITNLSEAFVSDLITQGQNGLRRSGIGAVELAPQLPKLIIQFARASFNPQTSMPFCGSFNF
jgi:hypothetical protein